MHINAVADSVLLYVNEGFRRGRMLIKTFWVLARRQFLVYDQSIGITCLSHLQGLR
jgi:hypothetical protein